MLEDMAKILDVKEHNHYSQLANKWMKSNQMALAYGSSLSGS
jgi:hypothetical protein